MVISGAGRALSWARERVPHPSSGTDDPPSGPVAAYARVLGGDVLYLDIEGLGESVLALRQLRSGEVVETEFEPAPTTSATGFACTLDLRREGGRLGGPEKLTYVLVALDPGRRKGEPRPVPWTGQPLATPVQADTTSDHRWSFRLGRGAEALRLAVRPVEPAARISAVGVDDGALVVTFGAPGAELTGEAAVECVELADGDDGAVTARRIPGARGDLLTVRLAAADLDGPSGSAVALRLADAGHHWPLRRGHADLRQPGDAVVMPILEPPASDDGHVLRAGYRPDGQLVVRRAAPPRAEGAE